MAKSPSHGRDMGALYLIFWRRNYPHDRGTRPRVQPGGLKQDDVGGVLLAAPSALCGSPVPAQGKQVRLCLLPHGVRAMGRTLLPRQDLGFRIDWLASEARYARVF